MSLTPETTTASLDELNPPQADAVAHQAGPLLVFAGAGSGKTRVITYRIANLVACARVPPYRILAVTFTNKAAGEMRARLGKLLGEGLARDLWVGTFHATSAKLLRRHGEALGLPSSFVIYDTDDQKAVMNRVLRALDLDDKRYPPRLCLSAVHKEKQELRGPDDMDTHGDPWLPKIFRAYQEQLRAANAVDFEDLIGFMVKLLEENPEGAGDALRRRFDYLLVDEFQDTNAAQYRFLKGFVRDHRNLCVVGDDDQSIYKWRGADVRNIRGFKGDFPEAHVVKLEQNYRSTGRIVRAALGVIEKSRERVPKDLWTANAEGAPIDVVATRDERDEAAHVLATIQEARARGVDPKEIAVFYRVHAQSRVLEEALRSANVPYQIVGGTKFYERAEIKNALAYLRVLVNPASDVDLLRIINTPARGIGSTSLERLVALADAQHIPLFSALARIADPQSGAALAKASGLGTATARLASFHALLDGLAAKRGSLRPSDLLQEILDKSGYVTALRAEDTAESEARLENLAELTSSLFDYESEAAAAGEAPSLEGYLERVSLQSDVDGMKDASRVTLMTVHGAKGLEFEVVLLTGMEQDMFPYRGMSSSGDHGVEEERRLAYVAITRARSRLIVTYTDTRQIFGTTRLGGPSPFLALMPRDAVTEKSTAQRGSSPIGRFVDRSPGYGSGYDGGRGAWQHPQGMSARAATPAPAPGERYVDREFFEDTGAVEDGELRQGTRVVHAQFGEGEVRSVVQANEPAVVVAFPGRGEKKILARFLRSI